MIKKKVKFLIMLCCLVVSPMLLTVSGYESNPVGLEITSPANFDSTKYYGVGRMFMVEATATNAFLVKYYVDNVYQGKKYPNSSGYVYFEIDSSSWYESSSHTVKLVAMGGDYETATKTIKIRRHVGAVTYLDFLSKAGQARNYLSNNGYALGNINIAIIDQEFQKNGEPWESYVINVFDADTRYEYTPSNWGTVDSTNITTDHGSTVASFAYKIATGASLSIIKYGSTIGLLWAIDYAIQRNADVIVISAFDTNDYNRYVELVLKQAFDANIFIACAAGQQSLSTAHYPASSPYTCSVGASDIWGYEEPATNGSFNTGSSNFSVSGGGSGWDMMVQDNDINQTSTSWSTPMVGAVAALIKAKYQYSNPNMSPRMIAAKMRMSMDEYIGDYVIDPYISVLY